MPDILTQRAARPPKPQYQDLFQEPALPARSTEWDNEDLPDTEAHWIITP